MTKGNFSDLMSQAGAALLADYDSKAEAAEVKSKAALGKIDVAVAAVKVRAEEKIGEIDKVIEDRFKKQEQLISAAGQNLVNTKAELIQANKALEVKLGLQATAIELLKKRLDAIENKAVLAGKALIGK